MTTTDLNIFDRHPEVAQRLTDRINAFVRAQPEEMQLDLELSSMLTSIGINRAGTVVISVRFTTGIRTVAECHFDGATIGLHAVAGEVLALEADQ